MDRVLLEQLKRASEHMPVRSPTTFRPRLVLLQRINDPVSTIKGVVSAGEVSGLLLQLRNLGLCVGELGAVKISNQLVGLLVGNQSRSHRLVVILELPHLLT